MNRNALHQLWVKRPFTPFRVLTSDGKSYDIGHPEHLWITPVLIGVNLYGFNKRLARIRTEIEQAPALTEGQAL
jgi:hypothetical protein